jgi:hypothetical protein
VRFGENPARKTHAWSIHTSTCTNRRAAITRHQRTVAGKVLLTEIGRIAVTIALILFAAFLYNLAFQDDATKEQLAAVSNAGTFILTAVIGYWLAPRGG